LAPAVRTPRGKESTGTRKASAGGTAQCPFNASLCCSLCALTQVADDLEDHRVGRYNWMTPDQYNDAHSALNGGFTYKGTLFTGDQASIAAPA
jgi:hypothetical protein